MTEPSAGGVVGAGAVGCRAAGGVVVGAVVCGAKRSNHATPSHCRGVTWLLGPNGPRKPRHP
jgi:hypothetical protein